MAKTLLHVVYKRGRKQKKKKKKKKKQWHPGQIGLIPMFSTFLPVP